MDGTGEGGKGGKGGAGGSAPHEHAPDISHIIIERLQRENEKLREQRRKSLMIEITGKGGLPVYATGSIDHGNWRFAYGGLWDAPDLEMTDEFKDDDGGDVIPLSALRDIEIYLGGVLYASATSEPVEAQMEEQPWDHEMGKELLCHFGGSIGVWLPIRISGVPLHFWETARNHAYNARSNDDLPDFDVYGFINATVEAGIFPNATLSFKQISFFGRCIEKLLRNNDIGQLSEEEKREQEIFSQFTIFIASSLRNAGANDYGDAFVDRLNIVKRAAYMMESMEVAKDAVPR